MLAQFDISGFDLTLGVCQVDQHQQARQDLQFRTFEPSRQLSSGNLQEVEPTVGHSCPGQLKVLHGADDHIELHMIAGFRPVK